MDPFLFCLGSPLRKSIRRPGVESKMSHPLCNCFNCFNFPKPPKQGTKRCPIAIASFAVSEAICVVNSRVGARTSTVGVQGSPSGCGLPLSCKRTIGGMR